MISTDPVKLIRTIKNQVEYLGALKLELIEIYSNSRNNSHENDIHKFLDHRYANTNFSQTDKKYILLYDEVIYPEILVSIHTWFSKKSCNIKNIFLVTTQTAGLKEWYQDYLRLFGYGTYGMSVIELPLYGKRFENLVNNINVPDLSAKKINRYFTLYAGGRPTVENDFIAAIFLDLKSLGLIDYLAGFSKSTSELDIEFEALTRFSNRQLVDHLLENSKTVFTSKPPEDKFIAEGMSTAVEGFNGTGFQFRHDSTSFFQISRETINNIPWVNITEKMLRAFVHKQVVISLSGQASTDTLIKLGFKFDKNFFDFDKYQYIPDFADRCIAIRNTVEEFCKRVTLEELEQYYIANHGIFSYNYNFIVSGEYHRQLEQKFIQEINQ